MAYESYIGSVEWITGPSAVASCGEELELRRESCRKLHSQVDIPSFGLSAVDYGYVVVDLSKRTDRCGRLLERIVGEVDFGAFNDRIEIGYIGLAALRGCRCCDGSVSDRTCIVRCDRIDGKLSRTAGSQVAGSVVAAYIVFR